MAASLYWAMSVAWPATRKASASMAALAALAHAAMAVGPAWNSSLLVLGLVSPCE